MPVRDAPTAATGPASAAPPVFAAAGGSPRRLVRLVLGHEPIPEAMSVHGGDAHRFLLEPVTAVAVVLDEGWVLLDSGFNTATIRDPVARAAHYNYASYTAVVPPGDPLLDQVAEAGLDWADLAGCALSHLHADHTGGLRHLEDGPPVALQRAEWAFGTSTAGLRDVYFRDDYDRPDLDVVLLDGDTALAPGVTALDTRGHTPGHQSFRVDLPGRSVVLACDAADLAANLTLGRRCGTTTHPELAVDAQRAIERLLALAAEPGTEVWPGHDPDFWAWADRRAPHP